MMAFVGLHDPEPDDSGVMVQRVVAPWVMVMESPLGMASPFPEVTVAEKDRFVSAP